MYGSHIVVKFELSFDEIEQRKQLIRGQMYGSHATKDHQYNNYISDAFH